MNIVGLGPQSQTKSQQIASSRNYQKKSKLAELAAMIKGTSDPLSTTTSLMMG